ncbi:conjugal transfer mating pair stabilization protein TraG [Shewanella benthica]|nr:conjugal transfer mating pair stabilization protein TraG [Shewanella benthica]
MAVEIFTYSNGDVAKVIFNAIASLFASKGFGSMISICALFAVVATAFQFFIKRDHNGIMKWGAVYFAVPLFLINTTTSVQITDLTDPTGNYHVANVPAIVAYPTSWSSHYMYATTKLVEDIFHVPSDEQYSKTGMMFGAKLYRLSRQSQIENSELKGYWQHYLTSCIQGDILLNHKYTWKQLADAPDIWAFLASNNPSPLRAIQMGDNDFPVCKDALPRLKRMFETEANHGLTFLGQWVFGKNKTPSDQTFLNSSLTNGYQRYADISKSASQITLQNMTINAIREGLMDGAAVNNNTAAAFNYAYTQNKMQTTSMWAGMALQAREFLPMLQSILFLLFGCVAFLVVAIAMLPQLTFLVLGNYIKGFIYLGTWPVMFALINFIMTTRLSLSSTGITDIYQGITLSNVDPLQEMHARWAAMTGFLMMSVPILIVPLIMKGGASVMSSMSHQFSGMMNSVNARTSASAASGDINLGNAQVDNYSYNNTHANKLDTAGLDRTHGFTQQDSDGYSTTSFDSGKQVITGSGALSGGLAFSVNGNDLMSQSYTQSASNSLNASHTSGESLSQSTAAASSQAMNLSHGTSQSSSYGSNSATGNSGTHSKAFNETSSSVDNYAQEFGITKSEAWEDAIRLNAMQEAGLNVGTPGNGLTGLNAYVKGSMGSSQSTSETDGTALSDGERTSQLQSWQETFNSNIQSVKSYNSGEQASDTHGQSDSAMTSFVDNITQSENAAISQQAQLAESQNYTDAASRVESGSLSIGRNFDQDFVNYVMNERDEEGDAMAIIKGETAGTKAQRTELLEQFSQSDGIKDIAAQYANESIPQNRDDVMQAHQQQADNLNFNKIQTDNYIPRASENMLQAGMDEPQPRYYSQGAQDQITATASQGQREILDDVHVEERNHTPASVTAIDKEQARADAEIEHSLTNIMTSQKQDQAVDEQLEQIKRESSPFSPGNKL